MKELTTPIRSPAEDCASWVVLLYEVLNSLHKKHFMAPDKFDHVRVGGDRPEPPTRVAEAAEIDPSR